MMNATHLAPKSIDAQLADEGLRLADPNAEADWYVKVFDKHGRVIKVWATDAHVAK